MARVMSWLCLCQIIRHHVLPVSFAAGVRVQAAPMHLRIVDSSRSCVLFYFWQQCLHTWSTRYNWSHESVAKWLQVNEWKPTGFDCLTKAVISLYITYSSDFWLMSGQKSVRYERLIMTCVKVWVLWTSRLACHGTNESRRLASARVESELRLHAHACKGVTHLTAWAFRVTLSRVWTEFEAVQDGSLDGWLMRQAATCAGRWLVQVGRYGCVLTWKTHLSSLSANIPCPLNTGAWVGHVHPGRRCWPNMSSSTWHNNMASPHLTYSRACRKLLSTYKLKHWSVSIIVSLMKNEERIMERPWHLFNSSHTWWTRFVVLILILCLRNVAVLMWLLLEVKKNKPFFCKTQPFPSAKNVWMCLITWYRGDIWPLLVLMS